MSIHTLIHLIDDAKWMRRLVSRMFGWMRWRQRLNHGLKRRGYLSNNNQIRTIHSTGSKSTNVSASTRPWTTFVHDAISYNSSLAQLSWSITAAMARISRVVKGRWDEMKYTTNVRTSKQLAAYCHASEHAFGYWHLACCNLRNPGRFFMVYRRWYAPLHGYQFTLTNDRTRAECDKWRSPDKSMWRSLRRPDESIRNNWRTYLPPSS